MDNRPIGIFDSGVGGLTVLREIESILPHESIVYFGDTARVPYGNKSKSTIIKFSAESVSFLLGEKVKIVVVACNTASALALDYLKKVFKVPVIGVIEAGANRALQMMRKNTLIRLRNLVFWLTILLTRAKSSGIGMKSRDMISRP